MVSLSDDVMYCSQQINIPLNLPYILKQYAKAAIRTQPSDLLYWSSVYFRALANGDIPPAKDRLEYPPLTTPSGLSPGFLRVLIKQFGKGGIIDEAELIDRWRGVGLNEEALQDMLKLAGYNKQVRWLNFVAIAAGYLCPNLTQTMILICELLTEEPEGGSATIPLDTFLPLYKFLARMDCGPVCPLEPDFAEIFCSVSPSTSSAVQSTQEGVPASLQEIEAELLRKPSELELINSEDGLLVWQDLKPDIPKPRSPHPSDEGLTSKKGLAVFDNVEEMPTTPGYKEEKSDSEESFDNTGITLTLHDPEKDIAIEDITGPVVGLLTPKKENRRQEEEEGEEEEEEKRQEVKAVEEEVKSSEGGKSEGSTEDKVTEGESGYRGEDGAGSGSGFVVQDATSSECRKKKKKTAKKKDESSEGGTEPEQMLSEEEEEEEDFEVNIKLEEEEEEEEEVDKFGVRRKRQRKRGDGETEEGLKSEEEGVKSEEEVGEQEDEKKVRKERLEAEMAMKSKESLEPLKGKLKGQIYQPGKLNLLELRNQNITASVSSDPDSIFWVDVPGIGPRVPEDQIQAVVAYLTFWAQKQGNLVMPRNIKHFLCPPLDAQMPAMPSVTTDQ